MTILFPYFDVLAIPDAVGDVYTVMFAIAWTLFPLLFILSVIMAQSATLTANSGQSGINWKKFFATTIFCIVGLTLSEFIFLKIIAISEVIASLVMSTEEFVTFLMEMNKQNQLLSSSNILRWGKTFLLNFSGSIVLIAEIVFLVLRYALLCILYVLSPLAFVLAIFKPTRSALKGWFTNVFIISFWIVTLRIVEKIIISFNIDLTQASVGILEMTVLNVFYVLIIVMVPVITGKIFSGEHLGTVGSLAMAAGTAMASRAASIGKASTDAAAGAGKAVWAAAGGVKKGTTVIKNVRADKQNPAGAGVAKIQRQLKEKQNAPRR